MLVDDDALRIAAIGLSARHLVGRRISQREAIEAVLLAIGEAIVADAARCNHAADAADVTDLEFGDFVADRRDATDDFVAGDHRIGLLPPLLADMVDVGVADPGIKNLDQDIARTDRAALDRDRPKPAGRTLRAICPGRERNGAERTAGRLGRRGRRASEQRGSSQTGDTGEQRAAVQFAVTTAVAMIVSEYSHGTVSCLVDSTLVARRESLWFAAREADTIRAALTRLAATPCR